MCTFQARFHLLNEIINIWKLITIKAPNDPAEQAPIAYKGSLGDEHPP